MKSIFLKLSYVIAISAILISCKDEVVVTPANPLEGLIKLNEGYAIGAAAKLEIWGKKTYYMGYNQLVVVILDSVNLTDTLKDAHITFIPIMNMAATSTMPSMVHSCPVENPDKMAINGVFAGAIAYVMPTSMGGSWKLGIKVLNHKNNKEGSASFDVVVNSPTTPVMNVFTATDASKLVLSILQPSSPKVGMNDIEFTLHRKASPLIWPADSTYSLLIEPTMPSMGHGSPNNVNPVHVGNGHYIGKVNFSMTGEWKVSVVVKKDTTVVSSDKFFNIIL